MNKTKVRISPSLLDYRQGMAELVRQVVKEKFIAGVKPSFAGEPSWIPSDLLPPPKIEVLNLGYFTAGIDNIILIETSDDFGIINLFLIFKDENGNLIESGNAFDCPDEANHWVYITSVPVAAGTSVTVQAVATDQLGGVSTRSERTIVRPLSWQSSPGKNLSPV